MRQDTRSRDTERLPAPVMPAPVRPATVRPASLIPAGWRALRPHQWLKNLLVIVPGITAQHFDKATSGADLLAFIAFCLCASATYVINDLMDLAHDRAHPTKRFRPFAAGSLPLHTAIVLVPLLTVGVVAACRLLPWQFGAVLAGYILLTLGYSAGLKRVALIDVLVLACLYGLRILAGAAAVGVEVSQWLLSFAVFLFLGLALLKRCAELVARVHAGSGDPPGRPYRVADLPLLQTMASVSGYAAVLVFCLYINGATVAALYNRPDRLWAIPLILLYWTSRLLLLTHRGEMNEDPVLFAATDAKSIACAALIGVAGVAAAL